MVDTIMTIILAIQTIAIVLGAITVLQGVLEKCSTLLRMAFVVFPIGALLEFLNIFTNSGIHFSAIVLNSAVIMMLYWMWNQKDMFIDVNQMIKNKHSDAKYSFTIELKVILSCFAIWVLKQVNSEVEYKSVVREHIVAE